MVIATTRPPNAARVANLSLVIGFGAHPGRIRLLVADGELVVRLDQLSVDKVHEERLLGVDNSTAVFVLQDGDLLVRFYVDDDAVAEEREFAVVGHVDPAVLDSRRG